jgi:hypothetical protein
MKATRIENIKATSINNKTYFFIPQGMTGQELRELKKRNKNHIQKLKDFKPC